MNSIDLPALREALAGAISTRDVRADRLHRALYATDASVYQIVPLMVAFPASAADVAAAVQVCARFGVPITARGGGTSQAGQSIGPGVILDCSRHLDRIVEINAEERWVRVQPGCVLDELNRALAPHGLLFAPDISTSNRATIGGMIANNSSGARSVYYGKTIDHVLALDVVLSDGSLVHLEPIDAVELDAKCRQTQFEGECYRAIRRLAAEHADEIDRRFPKILRRVGGYNLDDFVPERRNGRFNLARMLIGSEGTLGLTVEAKLNLVDRPRARATMVVEFADLLDALAATPTILRHHPAAVEVVDKYVLDSTRMNPEATRLRDFLRGDPAAILLIELYGETSDELPPRLEALSRELQIEGHGYSRLAITEAAAQARAWKLRTMALGLSMAEKGDAKAISFVEDTAVAPDRLRDYIAELLQIVGRHGTKAGVYAHASVGCLHVRPVVDLKTEAGVQRFEAIADEVADLVLKYGGALSGEHGDGLVRGPFQQKMYGPELYEVFREIKRTFDPKNILNPGKVVDSPPLSTNLRFGPRYRTPDVATTFDFSAEGGLLRAVELCAGVGACRKRNEGTMCPSYQATREEKDSTRGRANTLRLAITGQLGLTGLTDPAVGEALEFCLECKACKGECPTNVDMARWKAEFLHQSNRERGPSLRALTFGHVARLARVGSAVAPISNPIARHPATRWLNEKLLGIDRRRLPPAFARRTLLDRLRDRPSPDDPTVLLFADTFANFFEPEVGEAAIAVLERGGHRVVMGPTDLKCCGRPMISNGLLDEAVANARHNIDRLHEWASRGLPIFACEPSCLLTIRDDYPALVGHAWRARAERVAAACRTFEELVAPIAANLRLSPGPGRIVAHAHCHQRSLIGVGPMLSALRAIPGAEVMEPDAGCCGMAGSFGYEVEHYEVSRLVAEDRLLPAVRKSGPDDLLVAPGFSCRLQIGHFAGRSAVHPAVLLRSCLEGRS